MYKQSNEGATESKKYQINKWIFILVLSLMQIFIFFQKTAECRKPTIADVELFTQMQSFHTLPDYCKVKLTALKFAGQFRSVSDPKKIDWPEWFGRLNRYWADKMGPMWFYMHHYCRGVKWFNDYSLMTYGEKKSMKGHGTIKNALSEFQFIQNELPGKSFPLTYLLYRYLSFSYQYLGEPQKAQWALEQAMEYKAKEVHR